MDVRLDAGAAEWVISDTRGQQLRRRPAPQFTRQAVMSLSGA